MVSVAKGLPILLTLEKKVFFGLSFIYFCSGYYVLFPLMLDLVYVCLTGPEVYCCFPSF